MNMCKKLFASLGSADASVLSQCDTDEQNIWISAGIMNLLTSAIFGIMIANAFHSVFQESIRPYFLILIGLFFTSISFTLTFALSGAIKNPKRGISKFSALIPRLAICIVFSLLTTGVLVTHIYGSFLPHGRGLLVANAANTSNSLMDSARSDEQLRLRNELTRLDSDINELILINSELILSNPSVIHAIEARDTLYNRLSALTTQHRNANLAANNRIAEIRRSISMIDNEIESLRNQYQTENILRRIQDLNASAAAYNSRINNETRAINSRNTELSNMQGQLNVLQAQVQQRMLESDSQNRDRITMLTHQFNITEASYREIGASIAADIEGNRIAADRTFRPGLIADLVVLQYLMSFRNDASASFEDRQIGKMISGSFMVIMLAMLLLDVSPILILLIHGSNGLYNSKISVANEARKQEDNLKNEIFLFNKKLDADKAMKEKKIKAEGELLKFVAETRTQRVLDEQKDLLDKTILFNEYQRNTFAMTNQQLEPINATSPSDWESIACSIYETYVNTHENVTRQFLEKVYDKDHSQSMDFD